MAPLTCFNNFSGSEFWLLINFSSKKCRNSLKTKFQRCWNFQINRFGTPDWQKLISQKIWEEGKLTNLPISRKIERQKNRKFPHCVTLTSHVLDVIGWPHAFFERLIPFSLCSIRLSRRLSYCSGRSLNVDKVLWNRFARGLRWFPQTERNQNNARTICEVWVPFGTAY